MFKRRLIAADQASVFMEMTSVHISSGLVLHQMTSDHNRSELGIQDHSNEHNAEDNRSVQWNSLRGNCLATLIESIKESLFPYPNLTSGRLNLHVQFSENTPNIAGRNQSNGNAGTKACEDAGKARMETVPGKDYILLPLWTNDPPFSQSSKSSQDDGSKPSSEDEKKVEEDPRKDSVINVVGGKTSIELPDYPNMPALEDYSIFDLSSDDQDNGAEVDMNNLDTTIQVSPILTKGIHKDHLVKQIIRDLNSTPQTRRMTKNLEEDGLFSSVQQRTNHKDFQNCMFACFLSQEEPKKVIHALKDPSWIEAMQEELLQFKLQEVWTLVELPNGKRAIGTKWVFRNKKDEKGIVIKNKARLMDVKSAFLYGKIEEEVYVCQLPGFEDLNFPDRVYKVEKELYRLHKAPRAWYKTLSTYLLDNGFQRGKIDKTLFIRRDKGEILLVQVTASKAEGGWDFYQSRQDQDGEEVDVYLYRSMIGSLMYLTSSRPDIMFAMCTCATYQVNPKVLHLHAVKRIFSDYAGASLDRKSTTGGCQFLGSRLISWQCKKQTVVANSTTEAEYVAASSCCGQVLWIQNQLLDYGDCNEKKLIHMVKIHTDKNIADLLTKAFDNGIGVNAGDSKLMLLGINLLLLGKVNAARHKLTAARESINLLLLLKVNAARHNLQLLVNVNAVEVAFLAKPAESEGFEQIVDFLNAHTIKYALTVNPTIYTSCIEQFWATVKVKTVNVEVWIACQMLPFLKNLQGWGMKNFHRSLHSIRHSFLFNGNFIHTILQCLSAKTTAWNEFSSTMASAFICQATNQKFNFSKYIFEIMVKNLDNAGKFLMYPRIVQVFLDRQLEGMSSHKRIYVTPSHTKKIFRNMKRVGKGFSGRETPLFPTMVVQNQAEMGEGSAIPTDPHHTPTIIQPSTSQPQKKQRSRRPKRKDTEVPQPSGPTSNVADEAVNEEMDDSLERAATTATGLDAEQDRGNIDKTQSKATPNEPSSLGTSSYGGPRRQETMGDTIAQTRSENVSKFYNDPLLARGNILRSGEDRLKLQELMELCTNLQNRVIDLENTKTAQAQEITSLKLRVKKLEKKGGSRTHKLKRLYKVRRSARIVSSDEASLGDQEDASKQVRKIDDIDKDVEITLVDETQGRYGDDIMFDVSDLAGEEVFVAEQGVPDNKQDDAAQVNIVAITVSTASTILVSAASITDVEITLAQALAELKSSKPTTATSTRSKAKGLVIHEQEQAPTPIVSSQQPSQAKI
ncbi:putative ribonuclease H-like domain-containing protein [Tanacetum coccineum]